jgi:hypothetical protein
MTKSSFALASLTLLLTVVASSAQAQTETEIRLATAARRELGGRSFKLTSSDIRVHRVTLGSQKKLAKAHAQSNGEARELISSALGEIMTIPLLTAVCNAEQTKNNTAYRATSIMYDSSFGFTFRVSRDMHCEQLSIREIEMTPLELSGTSLKLALTIDHTTNRVARCDISSVEGMWNLWKDVTARCSLADGEGTFSLEVD